MAPSLPTNAQFDLPAKVWRARPSASGTLPAEPRPSSTRSQRDGSDAHLVASTWPVHSKKNTTLLLGRGRSPRRRALSAPKVALGLRVATPSGRR
jgi:hypothetical protein